LGADFRLSVLAKKLRDQKCSHNDAKDEKNKVEKDYQLKTETKSISQLK
jgi:hypothetical protein